MLYSDICTQPTTCTFQRHSSWMQTKSHLHNHCNAVQSRWTTTASAPKREHCSNVVISCWRSHDREEVVEPANSPSMPESYADDCSRLKPLPR